MTHGLPVTFAPHHDPDKGPGCSGALLPRSLIPAALGWFGIHTASVTSSDRINQPASILRVLSTMGGYIWIMESNIILVGFMGCGKSTIGRRVAQRLGCDFLDSDELVVAKAGKSISGIFADEGENRFREMETAELAALDDSRHFVLATGGGAILSEKNREILRKLGCVVWLHADLETLFERASRTKRRPLLEVENPRSTFASLLESRIPLYKEISDISLDATGLSHDQTVENLISQVAELDKTSIQGQIHGD